MPWFGTNIYKKARLDAGLTQEQAAELLDWSVESLKAYETGLRRPPDARAAEMAEAYRTPWLRVEHARETDELGIVPEGAACVTLPQVTVQLVGAMLDWSQRQRARQLLRIAADGIIDAAERPILDTIVCELEAIAAAWLALRHMGPPGSKKERPEVAASKRSVVVNTDKHLNHASILTHSPEMSRKTLLEGR